MAGRVFRTFAVHCMRASLRLVDSVDGDCMRLQLAWLAPSILYSIVI